MDFEPLLSLILESGSIAIETHANADADAVGSSLALKMVLENLGKSVVVITPNSISKLGRVLAESQGQQVQTTRPLKHFDLIVHVDCRPQDDSVRGRRLAVIDHHQGPSDVSADFSFVNPAYTSASEMVYEFLEYLIEKEVIDTISQPMALQLLSGIIADTGNLRLSTRSTLQRVVRIGTLSGVEPRDVFSLMRTPPDHSLRMACLKGASRLKLKRTEGNLIAITQVSSFQGDVASSLIHLGADVAFAGGRKKGTLNISGRARHELVMRGLSLADIMRDVATKIGGRGGGHAGAAALKGQGDVERTLSMCVSATTRAIARMEPSSEPSEEPC